MKDSSDDDATLDVADYSSDDSTLNVADVIENVNVSIIPAGEVAEKKSSFKLTRGWVQELTRVAVVLFLLLIIAGIIVYSGTESTTPAWPNVKDWLQVVLPTMAAFLGSSLGFYFSVFVIERKDN